MTSQQPCKSTPCLTTHAADIARGTVDMRSHRIGRDPHLDLSGAGLLTPSSLWSGWANPPSRAFMVGAITGHPGGLSADDDELFLALGLAVAAAASLEWAIVELRSTLLHSPRGLIAVAGEGVERARAGCLEMAATIGPQVDTLVREAYPWSRN